MNARFFDWIWHVRGSLDLDPGLSDEEVFDRLDPLFQQEGTSFERTGDTLVFSKKDPAAQDKMSVFDSGVLRVEKGSAGPVLKYVLNSRILLFCFLAPLLFVAFGQATVALGKLEGSLKESASGKDDKKDRVLPLNPIDKALGAPEPEAPDKDKKDDKKDDKKPSPTAAYVFAAIFAVLYVVGRVLESWLVRSLFRKRLLDEEVFRSRSNESIVPA